MIKRAFDLTASASGLLLLSPIFCLIAVLIKLNSQGPVFFRQERIGRHFRPFRIYKFRTMVADAPEKGGPITIGDDPRITSVGRFLRRAKLDELPQLINVLKGDMGFVGPRPEVKKYVDLFAQDYAEILKVRPGITDLASLHFRDEAALLGHATNPEEEYVQRILPQKIRLGKEYLKRSSFSFDLSLILKTVCTIFGCKTVSKPAY